MENNEQIAENTNQPQLPEMPEIISPGDSGPQIEPPKKRRGRPPKNPELSEEKIGADTGAKKRTYKKSANDAPIDSANLAKQIQGVHMAAATITGLRELVISEGESIMLAESLCAVSREYGLAISGKTGATIQLIAAAAMIYAPRFIVINERIKKNKAQTVDYSMTAKTAENGQS